MNLRDAVLCIDCDVVFTIEGSPCNPQCPRCASSVLMPLSAWARTWTAFDRGVDEAARGYALKGTIATGSTRPPDSSRKFSTRE
ncbi:MAG: hypothetical protein ABSD38_36350 [Syntrophorhabdales bacterium]|jgi:hypothetical protein